jgi:hypothetical protein
LKWVGPLGPAAGTGYPLKRASFLKEVFESDGYGKKGEWDGGAAEDQERV